MGEEPPSIWDQEPQFVTWGVVTWEQSFDKSNRVRECKRLLPVEMTAPIYTALAEREKVFLRLTEPLLPLQARLLRNIDDYDTICELNDVFAKRFVDVIPNWETRVTEALGPSLVSSLGVPKSDFLISDGYKIDISKISGRDAGVETHRLLLMGCKGCVPIPPPGTRRDLIDKLRAGSS